MTQPFFSIVIPTYNRSDFITKTIESLLNQTFTDFEIIVIDDGSTDNTEEVVKRIKDNRLFYYKKENAERGAARNYGAKHANGQYINFFDSDDLAYKNHLQEAYRIITDNNFPKIIALGYDIADPKMTIIRKRTPFRNINQQLINGNLLSCNGVFVKKEIALTHPFSEIRALSASEDYLLWLQIASKYKIYFSNNATSVIIEHDNRSVLNINIAKLIKRKLLMLSLAINNQDIRKFYKHKLKYLKANTYSYIALHAAMAGDKKTTFNYLIKALKETPTFVFQRRFFAIIKFLAIIWH